MNKQTTFIYAFPIDRFDRDTEDRVIIEAYESEDNDTHDLPVLKMTPSELAEKINDEMFDDQEYWLRAIDPVPPDYCQMEEQLRREIIAEIIATLRKEGMDSITFSPNAEDFTEVIWFDRHDFPSCSRVEVLKISGEELELVTEEGVSLFTGNDFGPDDIRTLNSLLQDVSEVNRQHYTAKTIAVLGAYLKEKGHEKMEFDHKSYDSELSIPTLMLEDKRQKINWIKISPDGTVVEIETETSGYLFEIKDSKDESLAFIENALRQMGMEDVLEAIYYNVCESKDEPFDLCIHNRLKDE